MGNTAHMIRGIKRVPRLTIVGIRPNTALGKMAGSETVIDTLAHTKIASQLCTSTSTSNSNVCAYFVHSSRDLLRNLHHSPEHTKQMC